MEDQTKLRGDGFARPRRKNGTAPRKLPELINVGVPLPRETARRLSALARQAGIGRGKYIERLIAIHLASLQGRR